MRITKLFIIFCAILLLNSAFSSKSLSSDQNLAQSICKITNDITKSTTETQDILIGNPSGQVWSSTVNDIIKCIDDGTAVVVTDLSSQMLNKNLRKASVVIVTLDRIDGVSVNDVSAKSWNRGVARNFFKGGFLIYFVWTGKFWGGGGFFLKKP